MSETSLARRTCELVLDTSALLLVCDGVSPIDEAVEVLRGYCSETKIVLLEHVVRELNRLAAGGGRRAVAARLALAEINKRGSAIATADVVDCCGTDECILKYARGASGVEAIVLTADKKLAKALKRGGIKYMTWWKSRRRFVLEFPIDAS